MFKLGIYFIQTTCIVAPEEVNAVKRAELEMTSPELKRPLIQFAVVNKTHKHTGEKYQQRVLNITATSEYVLIIETILYLHFCSGYRNGTR